MATRTPSDSSILDAYVVDVENLHHIQRNILTHLYTVNSAPYVDLKPRELSGNSFNYHLRHVVAQKLIEQASDGQYRLTNLGCLLFDNVSLESMKLKLRPTTGVSMLLKSIEHGTLLYRSNREPLRGFAGLPFGKLRLGDTLTGTFERMLLKRGLNIDAVENVHQLGVANVRYFFQNELVCHRMTSVWVADYNGPAHITNTNHGKSLWLKDPLGEEKTLAEVKTIMEWPTQQTSLEITAEITR
jgi:hypothetical protein